MLGSTTSRTTRTRLFVRTAPLIACSLALTLTACGSRDEGDGDDSASGGGSTTITIGYDSPLSKDLAAVGLGMRNSAELAVKQANKEKAVPGVTFKLQPRDDQGTPNIGQQNAAAFVSDTSVIGVVGAYNSSVTAAMQSTLHDARMVQISGANTAATLTKGADYTAHPERQYDNYFRTISTDDVAVPVTASYLYNDLKIKKIATVDDKKTYGSQIVDDFTTAYKKLGGKVVIHQSVNPDESDYSAVVNSVKSSGAQGVFYGGEYPQAAALKKQLVAAGFDGPMGGGDAVKDDQLIALAGAKAADGTCTHSDGAPIEKMTTSKSFVSAYEAAGYQQTYGVFGIYTYDATTALIKAVAAAVKADGGKVGDVARLRPKVVAAMGKVSFEGATGTIGFNEYGDSTNPVISINCVKNGKWADGVKVVTVK
ncbi:branched-chain amino acid ABC transporter substrate-binding protein [Streptomyces sp. VRA16 Mangrove soil]|uniref:branched-chain amino acid ABC transporter substrate-binding protein n=1 Tax=Streptomyces sp. VRA16 Mangrove soil TaxID=2817434 RepID=UPI001A9CE737|nr:branched-chain amino acid ABC transporter substrate-binding protein [Streptomyces sp. VRA16 Mangrove soil]MBO1331184.1 branched-chain amino acid ABC transporter substrate-binding protein [Streptomyces sp. VRA16 Mangrove soil]